jgi:segregation and condensation protein B
MAWNLEKSMNPETEEIAGSTPAAAGKPETLPDSPLMSILEALLFASEEPVTADEIGEILGKERTAEIEEALEALCRLYSSPGGGLRVQRLAGGFRITTDPDLGPFVREMVRSRNKQRLSRAALETLAVVAYKQPITAPEIQEIRGVNPSAILNSLLERRLIRILGRKKVVGKPFLYGTTREFMILFGLNSLADLPSLQEFEAMVQESSAPDDEPPSTDHLFSEGTPEDDPESDPGPSEPAEDEL